MNNSVTAIIVNWNSGELLLKCLTHLAAQTRQPDEILVIDNASSTDPAPYVEKFGNAKLLQMNANLGFAAANNVGINDCSSDYVLLINPDAFAEPECVENLLRAVADYPEACAFGCLQLSYQEPEIVDGIGDRYNISGRVKRDRYGMKMRQEDLKPGEIFSPCAAAALYRREALIEVGGFDEDYFCYVEDVDLGFRLRLAGYRSRFVPDAIVQHAGSATTGGQHSNFSAYYGHRNLVWTFIKNMPGLLLLLLLPLHLLMNISAIALLLSRGQGKVAIKAKWDAIKGLQKIWKKRKNIQKMRRISAGQVWAALDKQLIPR